MSYYEIDTTGVYSSGQQVAAHSSGARSLASQFITSLGNAHDAVHHATMVAAVGRFQEQWQPRVNQVAPQIDALGTNTSSSATVVAQSDQESTALLAQQGAGTEAQTSTLSRPITA